MRHDVLSPMEIQVLKTIDHIGWYGQLWFPTVHRNTMDFPDGPSDDEVHTALFSLVESGVLEVWRVHGDEETRIETPPPEVIAELRKHSTETEIILQIEPEALEELHANERRRWIEIRNTESSS